MKFIQKRLSLKTAQLKKLDGGAPTFLMTIQIELSKLLDKVQGIGAGILTLNDIVRVNKQTHPDEVRSFF